MHIAPNAPAGRRSAQAAALALSLLLAAPSAALADEGVRRGGSRRAPPPPPTWVGGLGSRPAGASAPSVAPSWRTTSPQSTTYERRPAPQVQPLQHAPGVQPRSSLGATPSHTGVRPIQLGQAPRVSRPASAPLGTPAQPRSLPVQAQGHALGLRRPGSTTLAAPVAPIARPPAGTAPSPTWDNRRLAAPSVRTPSPTGLVATPRASLPRATTMAAPRTAGVRYGAPGAPATLQRLGGGASTAWTGTSGAGVRYGGAPHAHGFYGYAGGPYRGRYYGVGPGYYPPTWYAPPVYVEPVISIGFWGYGSCGCAPSYGIGPVYPQVPAWALEPAPPVDVEPLPQVYPHAYEAPAPAPYVAPPSPAPQPPAVPQPSVQDPAAGPAAPFPPPGPAPESVPAVPSEPADGAQAPPTLSPEDEKALQQSLEEFRAGRFGAAQATLEGVAARTPALGHAWLGIAHAAFAMERYQRAGEALTRAALLGAFPRGYSFDPRVLYARPEDFLERKQTLEQRVSARPQDADARLVLAWLRVSLGERDLARADLDAVLRLRPADEAAPLLSLALLPAAPATGQGQPEAMPAPAQPAQPPVPEAR